MRSFHLIQNSNISIANVWVKGGSDMDSSGLKGINNIMVSLISRGCEFDNFELSVLNQMVQNLFVKLMRMEYL